MLFCDTLVFENNSVIQIKNHSFFFHYCEIITNFVLVNHKISFLKPYTNLT